jgi:hypothetical protein
MAFESDESEKRSKAKGDFMMRSNIEKNRVNTAIPSMPIPTMSIGGK